MARVLALVDPVREFFLLRRAEQAVRRYSLEQHALVRALVDAGDARARAARWTVGALPASVLWRDALRLYLRAASVAEGHDTSASAEELARLLPPVPSDPASPRSQRADDAQVRAALLATDDLYLDRIAAAEIEQTRWALERACRSARGQVEARSITNLRGLRWGRLTAIAVVAAAVAWGTVRGRIVPADVALGKPVHPSSRRSATPEGQDLVDGDVGTSFAIHTNTEDNPNVVIDLLGTFSVDKVVVYNRVDGWFDDSLPLVVELSLDGSHYEEVGRREQHFDADPPWTVAVTHHRARFVRLRVARRSYLALSEVEVFGGPARY